jgi:hypothetical protein
MNDDEIKAHIEAMNAMTDDDEIDDYDDTVVMRLTPQALAMLAADEDGTARLDPRMALMLEVLRQVGGQAAGWEIEEYCNEIVAAYGDDAKALAALRSGQTSFTKVN